MSELAASLIAGDTWDWTHTDSNYPASVWSVTYHFENSAGSFSATGTPDGNEHAFSISAATTASYKAGKYRWHARATSGATVKTIATGWLTVKADIAAAGKTDVRSWAQRTLDAVEATLEGRATRDQTAMSIAGRSISRIPIAELIQLRDKLRAEVQIEEQGSKAGLGRNIRVRLSRV